MTDDAKPRKRKSRGSPPPSGLAAATAALAGVGTGVRVEPRMLAAVTAALAGIGARLEEDSMALSGSGTGVKPPRIQAAGPVTLRRGAVEYNVGRSAETSHGLVQLPVGWTAAEGDLEPVIAVPRRPLTSTAQRVASVITGLWVTLGAGECDPDRGTHLPACPHRDNRVRFSRYQAARAAFRRSGGSQLRQVDRALDELYDQGTEFLIYDPESGGRLRQRGRILELTDARRDEHDDVLYEVRWGAYLLDSLMAGHYQAFPIELVQELTGSDFLVWLTVLCQRSTARLTVGDAAEWSVTGPRGWSGVTIRPERLGLGRQRPDRLARSLERAAERGNPLAESVLGLRLAVQERAQGGLKLVLTRVRDRAELAARTGSRADRQSRPPGTATEAVRCGNPGRSLRQSRPRIVRESGSLDVSLDSLETSFRDRASRATETLSSSDETGKRSKTTGEPPDVAALRERWRRVSPGQRRILAELADRHDLTGREGAARIIRGLPADHPDPFRAVLDADRDYQHGREQEARDREAQEAREARDREAQEAARALGSRGDLPAAAVRPEMSRSTVPRAARLTPPTPPPPDPETAERRRSLLDRLIAEGLDPVQAAELRRRYGVDEPEASGNGDA